MVWTSRPSPPIPTCPPAPPLSATVRMARAISSSTSAIAPAARPRCSQPHLRSSTKRIICTSWALPSFPPAFCPPIWPPSTWSRRGAAPSRLTPICAPNCWPPPVWSRPRRILALCAVVLPSGAELVLLTGAQDEAGAVAELLSCGPKVIVHKRGFNPAFRCPRSTRPAPVTALERPSSACGCAGRTRRWPCALPPPPVPLPSPGVARWRGQGPLPI